MTLAAPQLSTDPWFWVLAVIGVLLMGISKSGFGTGFGALAVPLMSLAVPVPTAAAILLPILLVMDVMGIAIYRRDFDRSLVLLLLPPALLGVVLGALVFSAVNAATVGAIVGGLTLVFLVQRLVVQPRIGDWNAPRWVGALLSVVSGFTTFVAHAGGPPINAYLIPKRLAPVTYAATIAVLFFAVNLAKWVPYGLLGLLDLTNITTSLVLVALAPFGVWLGSRVARRINEKLFYRLVYAGMAVTGVTLIAEAVW